MIFLQKFLQELSPARMIKFRQIVRNFCSNINRHDPIQFSNAGLSYSVIEHTFGISKSQASKIFIRVLMAIWSVLQLLDLPQPNMNILLESANNFHHIWNLPHCIGALDVCHMEIKRPHYSGTRYWSNKKYYSTTLQALVDARQRLGGLRLLENGFTRMFKRPKIK
ncbi:hypothetical protein TKK_0016013 [Trichogramma kaykai]